MTARSLVDRAKEGSAAAWSEIVRDLGPRIRGFARARGAPDPDDVMQDVFVAAAERIGDFDGDDAAFRSWIFSVAYRQIVNRHRRSGREIARDVVDGAHVASPEGEIERSEAVAKAVAAMHVLNDVERDVVLLRVIAELSTEDVAKAVGKSVGNVRVIQTRALAKVRAELDRTGYTVHGRKQ